MNTVAPRLQADKPLHTTNQSTTVLPKFLKIWLIAITLLLLANTIALVFLFRGQQFIGLKHEITQAELRVKELEADINKSQEQYKKTHPSP